jgi:hypothetical protein
MRDLKKKKKKKSTNKKPNKNRRERERETREWRSETQHNTTQPTRGWFQVL